MNSKSNTAAFGVAARAGGGKINVSATTLAAHAMKGKDIRMICRLAVMDRLLNLALWQRGTRRHVSRAGIFNLLAARRVTFARRNTKHPA
jgi:hypothetical protein